MDTEVDPTAPTTCFHHRDRETGRRCTRCGRSACSDCLHPASVGSHCWECIKAAAPPRSEQLKRAWRSQPLLVTNALVAVNLGIFVLTVASGGGMSGTGTSSMQLDYGLFAPSIHLDHEYYRLLTSGFIHFGFIHVAMNCFILYQLGRFLENDIGRSRFVAIYFSALVAGSAGALILSPTALTAGASGAVFGLAAASVAAQHLRGVPLGANSFFPFLVLNFVLSFSLANVSIGGHLGGTIGGALGGWALLAPHQPPQRQRLGWVAVGAFSVIAIVVGLVAARNGTAEMCNSPFVRC